MQSIRYPWKRRREAADRSGSQRTYKPRRFVQIATTLAATGIAFAVVPSLAFATPPSVPAYYIYGTSASSVEQTAYNDGCSFAKANTGTDVRSLMLDFGAARYKNGGGGTEDFSNYYLSNPVILDALESASNGANACYKGGTNEIDYGDSNDGMTASGMTTAEATSDGLYQAQRADDLSNYEANNNRTNQLAAVGIDMEPSYDAPGISKG